MNPLPLNPQDLFAQLQEPVNALASVVGLPIGPPDPLAATAPVLSVDERLEAQRVAITGQETPIGPPMQNRPIALKVFANEARIDALEQFTAQLLALSTASTDQLKVLAAQQTLGQQAVQALQTQQAAEALRLAAVEAKATLTASATEANRLDIVSLKAADVLLQTQAVKDEAAIAAAQATATQAKADAAAAQKKADEDATAVLVAQAAANQAQATATAAAQAQAAFSARFRSARVTVPKIDLGGTIDLVVPVNPAFTDANYTAIAEPAGLSLLGLDATEVPTARTAASVTFRIKNVPGLAIAAGGILNILLYHD